MNKYILLTFLAFSCQPDLKESKKGGDGAKESLNSGSPTTTNPGSENSVATKNGAKSLFLYNPRLGDQYTTEKKSKSWTSDIGEPNYDSPIEENQTVIALFNKVLRCGYRIKTSGANSDTETNMRCNTISELKCGQTNQPKPTCTEKALESKDIGIFLKSEGKEITCLTKTAGQNSTDTLVKTIRTIWSNKTSFAADENQMAVLDETLTCQMTLPRADVQDDSDPCQPPRNIISQLSKTSWQITDQIFGPGGTRHSKVETSDLEFEVEGMDNVQKIPTANCSMNGDKLNVSFNIASCQDGSPTPISIVFNDIPTDSTSLSPLTESQVSGTAGAAALLNSQHSCSAKVTKDNYNRMLTVDLDCANQYSFDNSKKVNLGKGSVTCFAKDSDAIFSEEGSYAGKLNNASSVNQPSQDNNSDSGSNPTPDNDNPSNPDENNSNPTPPVDNPDTPTPQPSNEIELPFPGQIVFVSSFLTNGSMAYDDMVGLEAADAHCTAAAQASELGLTGEFRAILSTNSVHARDRTQVLGLVYNAAAQIVASTETQFYRQGLREVINFDENGRELPKDQRVFTGSNGNAAIYLNQNCHDWSSAEPIVNGFANRAVLGESDRTLGGRWFARTDDCNVPARIYCLQVNQQQ